MKSKTSIWLLVGLLATFSVSAQQLVLDNQVVTSISDGTAPAYDCSLPTLPFFPVTPTGVVPAGDPVIGPPTPDVGTCDFSSGSGPFQCGYTCGEPVSGAVCVGLDCSTSDPEAFGDAEFKVKENNLRIRYVDSTVGDVLGQSWNLEANSSQNGGLHYFAFQVKSVGDEEDLFSDGSAPRYDACYTSSPPATLPFLFGSLIDPAASDGTIPLGDPVLEPVPSDDGACQSLFLTSRPDPAQCSFTCPQKIGFTERNVLRLGTGGTDPSLNNGVAIGANSVPEDGKITVGRDGLLRALKHLAIGLVDTDALNFGSMRLDLAAVNAELDALENRIAVLEGGFVASNPNDVNGDGVVNFSDIMAILPCFGQAVASSPQCANSDVNGDGVVNILDFSQVRGAISP